MQRVKARIFSGVVCEQLVFNLPDGAKKLKAGAPRFRFETEEEREKYNSEKSRRHFVRLVNTNFSPTSYYSTLTLDKAHEIHDFETAKQELNNYIRRLRRKHPQAKIVAVMGKGKRNHRVHFHMISEGIPEEVLKKKWGMGTVDSDHLWENVKYDDGDHGQDYTKLANYLFDHWTPEQGTKRWTATKNLDKPLHEAPRPAKREYSETRPPRMKGYILVESKATKYGLLYFKYVKKTQDAKAPPGKKEKPG